MKLIVLFICIPLLLTGCFVPSVPEYDEQDQASSTAIQESNTSSTIDTLIRSDLIHQWTVDIRNSDLLKKQFTSRLDTTRNIHWPDQIDTVFYYTTEKSIIRIYRTPEKDILMDSDLFDSDISLSSKLKIGVPKSILASILSQENLADVVLIGEEDSDVSFTFYFRDNLLYHIHFNCYID